MRTAVVIPTQDALRRALRGLDAAIEEARARGGGAWPLAREAKRRLEDVLAEPSNDGSGRILPWRAPAWVTGRCAHVFGDRHTAVQAARRALAELDEVMARGGFQAFQQISLTLADAFQVERPEGLDWRPDEAMLLQERAAVEAELRRLYEPREPAPPAVVEPLAATA